MAEDFAFAKRVHASPSAGTNRSTPERLMESVDALDPGTLVIRWRGLYAFANNLQMGDLDPLPRHILDQPFASLEQNPGEAAEAFGNLPYWRGEYVGGVQFHQKAHYGWDLEMCGDGDSKNAPCHASSPDQGDR